LSKPCGGRVGSKECLRVQVYPAVYRVSNGAESIGAKLATERQGISEKDDVMNWKAIAKYYRDKYMKVGE